jgi:hypothetical protein
MEKEKARETSQKKLREKIEVRTSNLIGKKWF